MGDLRATAYGVPAECKEFGKVKLWLADTGCGHGLVSKTDVYAVKRFLEKAPQVVTFQTVNGPPIGGQVCPLRFDELRAEIEPYVLNNSPSVLSIGIRCMEKKYTFIWPPGENPYFITPDDQIIQCEVHDHVPYIRPGAPGCQPKASPLYRCFVCAARRRRRRLVEAMPGRAASSGPKCRSKDEAKPFLRIFSCGDPRLLGPVTSRFRCH